MEEQIATDPSDLLFINEDRQLDREIVQLSFEFARIEAQAQTNPSAGTAQAQTGEPARYQSLFRAAQAADAEAKNTQDEIDANRGKLQSARGSSQRQIQATIDELQGELDLARIRSQTIHNLLQFVSGVSGNTDGLLGQIEQLRHSVPELAEQNVKPDARTGAASATTGDGVSSAGAVRASSSGPLSPKHDSLPSGILGLSEDLFSLHGKLQALKNRARMTDDLIGSAQTLRAPLIASLTAISQHGDELAKQADTSDAAQLEQEKPQLEALANQFKETSSTLLPLAKQSALLDIYRDNLLRWRDSVHGEYAAARTKLLLRIGLVALVLLVVFVLAEIWRRATFRYVHDIRRRYQFLLLRRIVLWLSIGITIAFSLASEIGSMVTFAGLITAGIAVALQNVILAIAGYFFLIGKYGVRPGDRIQISGITGDVIDIGLIRLHMLEIGGGGADGHATGRVVVFSNAVVFQPNASFFKQAPGTHFFWHEVSLMLAPDGDYRLAEQRMLDAVQHVYAEYKQDIEQQHRRMEETLNMTVPLPEPTSQLRLTQNGLEVVIRYPIELQNAAKIDDQITRQLLDALERSPKLKLVGTGTPNIQAVPEQLPPEHKAA